MSGIVASTLHAPLPELLLDITGKVAPDVPALLASAGWLGTAQPVRLRNTGVCGALVLPASLYGARISLLNAAGALIGGTRNNSTAVKTAVPLSIDNLGSLCGAGGTGGAGGNAWVSRYGVVVWGYGGDGGWGKRIDLVGGTATVFARTFGSAGTTDANNTPRPGGEFGGGDPTAYATGGTGGDGGDFGQTGYAGSAGSISGGYEAGAAAVGGAAGPAGYYIEGNSLVTWINTGTRLGGVKA